MKLLLITQKIDKEDPILGFFHRWVEEFAKNVDKVSVICLYEGEHNLSDNVSVYSLGKEKNVFKIKYLFNFYKYLWKLKKEYDAVFVHMNKEYVLLGSLFWLRKKVSLWYNHKHGNLLVKMSMLLSNVVFYTSNHAYTAKFKKSKKMPVGIDTDFFNMMTLPVKSDSLLFLSRISPVKKLEVLIDAVDILSKERRNIFLDVYGDSTDDTYMNFIKEKSKKLDNINFLGSVANYKTPEIFNSHKIFINLTQSGSMDKTIFEAMSCGSNILVSNESFKEFLSEEMKDIFTFKESNPNDLSEKILKLFDLKEDYSKKLRDIVLKKHSLNFLVKKVLFYLK